MLETLGHFGSSSGSNSYKVDKLKVFLKSILIDHHGKYFRFFIVYATNLCNMFLECSWKGEKVIKI